MRWTAFPDEAAVLGRRLEQDDAPSLNLNYIEFKLFSTRI
jgi:hypothetical protein